jgi:isoaspartyl peptidase/L-asparaginase-like protein (Ntn-hydrolase superfamily)
LAVIVVVDAGGRTAAGAHSNGAARKISGRVGDAAVQGGGAYATPAGACGSTGDGNAHLRFLPCSHALAPTEAGVEPGAAARAAVGRIAARVRGCTGAVIVADAAGRVGAAAAG